MQSLGEIGPYRPLAELGHDGTGRTFVAHAESGPPVLVTLVHAHVAGQDGFRDRLREDLATRPVFDRTAAVVDGDADAGTPWVAVELAPGTSLRSVTELAKAPALLLVSVLARVLRKMHRAGFVHGGLTPGAVRLTADGPVLVDTGIARAAGTHTPADDIHALGVLLAAVVGGGTPGRLHPRVRRIVAACTRTDPARRPAAAAVVAMVDVVPGVVHWPDQVRRFLAGDDAVEPVEPAAAVDDQAEADPDPVDAVPPAVPRPPHFSDGILALAIGVLVGTFFGQYTLGGPVVGLPEAAAAAPAAFARIAWTTCGFAVGLGCAVLVVFIAEPRTPLVPWLVLGGVSLLPFALGALAGGGVLVEVVTVPGSQDLVGLGECLAVVVVGAAHEAGRRIHPGLTRPRSLVGVALGLLATATLLICLYFGWLGVLVADLVRINVATLLVGAIAGSLAWRRLGRGGVTPGAARGLG
jgi:hypothetical protein